jgi:hypothetical protein
VICFAFARVAQEEAAAEMRRVRAAHRADALATALYELRSGSAAPDAAVVAAVQARVRASDTEPLWPPLEASRLLRARQWACLLAQNTADASLSGWYAHSHTFTHDSLNVAQTTLSF